MKKSIRFGDYLQEVSVVSTDLSYSNLMPTVEYDADGKEIPHKPQRLRLRGQDIYQLLSPYLSVRFFEQLRAVVPLAIYLGLFQWLILHQPVADSVIIAGGLLAVMVGLMLFLEGLKLGLMPFGEMIGDKLPRKVGLFVVLLIAFILGVGVTFAEPAIGALKVAGATVDPQRAPFLYALLTQWSLALVLVVGAGVGIAAVVGTLRFINGWSLKPLIYGSIIPTLCLTLYTYVNPDLRSIIGLAWDSGAVTTGPVTVPLILSLGIGVASAVSKGSSSLSGFGIVTLASIFPVFGVLVLGIFASHMLPVESILAAAQTAQSTEVLAVSWWGRTPGVEMVTGIRAILPLILFLLFILKVILKEKLSNAGIIRYGIMLTIIGMILFNVGLTYGLSKLGSQSGGFIPGAFTQVDSMTKSPLFGYAFGVSVAFIFAWVLGFGATLAEPALNALGVTVENLTSGTFKKSMLMYSVAIGVACGISIGVLKIIFDIPLVWVLGALYTVALVMTYLSTEEFVNVAWDSAGVTTGPITVPLVLAMGLGFGKAVGAVEGFGILSAASVSPIISVMAFGLYIQWRVKRATLGVEKNSCVDKGVVAV